MAKSKSSKSWLKEHFDDEYVRRSQQDGYRSRAIYKLIEIDEKDHIIKPGMTIIDLGAAPGGWSEYCVKKLGKNGTVVALDILPMDPIEGVVIIEGDFREDAVFDELMSVMRDQKADLVISDMAPNISGIDSVDQARSIGLAEDVLDWSRKILAEDGVLLIKVFQGSGFDQLRRELLTQFRSVAVRKPGASRSRSAEVYLLARGFKV
jgi:23S rRNA (uridine2552-2'-O)-methyltransferase